MRSFVLKTWNCFGAAQSLSAFVRWEGAPDSHRFSLREVETAAEGADILCLQELFLSEAERFFDRLPHEHKVRDTNGTTWWPLTFGGSGLGIASRLPIVASRIQPFGRPQSGAERFARKGMLHARVTLPGARGLEADVVTTHMQSGYGTGARRVRARQLAELRALLDEVGSAERPFILCGDLNIDGLEPVRAAGEYEALREQLSDFDDLGGPTDDATFHPDPAGNELAHRFEPRGPRQRIDYVLFRAARPSTTGRAASHEVRPAGCELALHLPFDHPQKGKTFASDHFALRVTFEHGPPSGDD